MAKGVITADWHIGVKTHSIIDPDSGLPSRWIDVWNSANYIVDYAIKNKADFFWLLGDVFHTNHPTPTEFNIAVQLLSKLENAGIQTIVFNGNHDYVAGKKESAASVLGSFRDWKEITFHSSIAYETGHGWGVQIIPHGFDINLLKKKRTLSKEFLLCHTTFDGCVVGSENFMLSSHVTSLPKGCDVDMILSGHIHKAQRLVDAYDKKIDVIYPGSIERVDFGEELEEKIFGWFDTDSMEWVDIINPIARKMFTVRSSADTISDFEKQLDRNNLEDRIVRVIMENDALSRSQITDVVKQHDPHIISQIKIMKNTIQLENQESDSRIDDDTMIANIIKEKLSDENEILRAMQIIKEIQNNV